MVFLTLLPTKFLARRSSLPASVINAKHMLTFDTCCCSWTWVVI